MISHKSPQPRRNCTCFELLDIISIPVGQAGLKNSHSWTQKEEIILRYHISRSWWKASALHGYILSRKTIKLVSSKKKRISVMSSLSCIQLISIKSNISITILFELLFSWIELNQILEISNRRQVIYHPEIKIFVWCTLLLYSCLISYVHIPNLLQIITYVLPKNIIFLSWNHLVHILELEIQILLNFSRGVRLSLEV